MTRGGHTPEGSGLTIEAFQVAKINYDYYLSGLEGSASSEQTTSSSPGDLKAREVNREAYHAWKRVMEGEFTPRVRMPQLLVEAKLREVRSSPSASVHPLCWAWLAREYKVGQDGYPLLPTEEGGLPVAPSRFLAEDEYVLGFSSGPNAEGPRHCAPDGLDDDQAAIYENLRSRGMSLEQAGLLALDATSTDKQQVSPEVEDSTGGQTARPRGRKSDQAFHW